MDVTRSNFKKLLPDILHDIESASFLAVDGEFTGLNNGQSLTAFDTPKQYYTKIRTGALDFLFVQFGLSIFKQIEGYEKYQNKTYVFYLFPEQLNRDAPDCRFLCQASSLSFLAQNGFDFNKLFKEGIPYLKQSDEDTLREVMAEKSKNKATAAAQSNNTTIPIPKQHQQAVDSAMMKIKELLSPDCEKEEIQVDKCSGFVRKLIYQTIREELSGSNINVETNKKGVLVARKGVSQEQLEKEKQEKADKEEESMQDAIGFTAIMKKIASSKKLLVGHNVLLDICHMVHRFIDVLPEDYFEFKEMVHSVFPKVLDTKYFITEKLSDLIPSSYLPNVVESISKDPFNPPEIDSEDGYSYDIRSEKYHNAGYDAFVTGLSFLTALKYLDSSKEVKPPAQVGALQKYINKLFLMKVPDTYIDLVKRDPEPFRDHVFHVSFPKVWTSQNLMELFSPFGQVQIKWLTDTTAWVALQDRGFAAKVKASLEDKPVSKNPGVVVKGYTRFSSNTGVPASSPRPNKRKLVPPVHNKPKTNVSNTGEGDRLSKKRKSSSLQCSIETIFEEGENNGSGAITVLEEYAKAGGKKASFPMDEDWS